MDMHVGFGGLVTFFCLLAPLASGGVVCWLGLFSTGGDVDCEAIVVRQVFISVGGGI